MRLALLVCDEPVPQLVQRYGDYPAMFRRFLDAPDVQWRDYDVFRRGELPPTDDVDAVVITGSRSSVNDSDGWIGALTDYVGQIKGRVPVVGICFGHQIVVRACGGAVIPSKDWELGWTEVPLSPDGVSLFKDQTLRIHSAHKEEAQGLPDGFVSLGRSSGCGIQGMLSSRWKMLTLQGHPEVTSAYIQDLAAYRHERGLIPDSVYEHVKKTRDRSVDRAVTARVILDFIRGALRSP